MFNKNLRYYRLMANMSKKELAEKANITPMAVTNYEKGNRRPSMEIIKALASALNVKVTDFLATQNDNLTFQHNAFRKNSKLSQNRQEFIRASVEEYFGRFYSAVELLGGQILPEAPECQALALSANNEENAKELRKYLKLPESGPIGNLVETLENLGILVYLYDIDCNDFSGMNGLVNKRPYIIVNKNMTPERIRTTIVHEIAHFAFIWPNDMEEKESEKKATAISGAFLLPKDDAQRELGIKRNAIGNDMLLVCKEYGISMYLLTYRAKECGIINEAAAKTFYVKAGSLGWRTNEPSRIDREEATLFEQLVYRAVSEEEISIQKGSEILKIPFDEVAAKCYFAEV